jgi:hypothetical protein
VPDHPQTIVLLGPATRFRAVCRICEYLGHPAPAFEARLAVDEDHGAARCAHGHPIEIVRAGRVLAA